MKTPGTLYRPAWEHDNCGIGAVADLRGRKSHQVVADALTIVENLEHRAGKDAEGKTGDGVGILTQVPHRYFAKACKALGIELPGEREYGVGMFFFPQGELQRRQAMKMFEVIVQKEGLGFLGWREVPVAANVLGSKARACMPAIWQGFVQKPAGVAPGLAFDRRLYVVRRVFEQSSPASYVCSLSSRTIVYKGMFLVGQLRTFFDDLRAPEYESALAIVHSRFSTNTEPSWQRAHPNRLIAHNGEINTIRGNVNKMLAREETMHTEAFGGDLARVLPVVNSEGSDSAMLDNALEFLMMSGMELPLAVTVTLPEPWAHNDTLSRQRRDFYQYYATMMEPWDGPAALLFSDGDVVGAVLDRNGLRPARYCVTDDGRLILASETGVLELDERRILRKGRLHPGKMLLADLTKGELLDDDAVRERYAAQCPYGEWLDQNLLRLRDVKVPNQKVPALPRAESARLQRAFGYTYEEYRDSVLAMALNGAEPIGAMGADTPLAVLSHQYQPLFGYFRQMFAQVTNPPIDALREKIVTSTAVYVGKNGDLLEQNAENCRVLKIDHPILSDLDLLKIKAMDRPGFRVVCVSILHYKGTPLKTALEHLFVEVDKAYRNGANVLILSDRGVDESRVAIPSLLAVSAVHQHLVKTKKCTALSLILESGEPREVHHFATLLGYGACAVNPYLAHACIAELTEDGLLEKDYYAAVQDYDTAVLQGVVKIASKMGISTLQSYQGSQLFEALGISGEVIDEYFTGTISRIGGITLADIARRTDEAHARAFDPLGLPADTTLPSLGRHKLRSGGEVHRYDPEAIHLLQKAVRSGDYGLFGQFANRVNESRTGLLRGLFTFRRPEHGVPLEEVESVESLVQHFKTGAMSYGSISQEAHEALAVAMNRLHGKSNSGEGGESDERLASAGTADDRCSAIKQVASGRFGVTSRYLVSAKEIQIKMAQGAKPGEGGHLPAGKVYPWIAKTRHSTPGVTLISPPPHHDIYSIEDLAELIYDLKCANDKACISVKLVSEAGVGTVASGVAKAGAQVILISGCDGGTGAAPLSSIHCAGLPWELGLAETHQTLVRAGLRSRVRIETDGKLMTGRDVAVAAMLGAEEFGFATAPLIALGCTMMRVCNLDTCPMGIATQNPELRKRFCGKPEYVENFMIFVARQLREVMASLGVRTLRELVGRTDLLQPAPDAPVDVRAILAPAAPAGGKTAFDPADVYDFGLEKTPDQALLKQAPVRAALEQGTPARVEAAVRNVDRAFGAQLGAALTRLCPEGRPDDTLTVDCTGTGGQSFGAFLPAGITLSLTGDSNDYFGKGLSGGKLAVRSPKEAAYVPEDNVLIGNVALYGATGGAAFINGRAGERFCVRNSGAAAVVEGVGEHGCEYMTGGRVVVLGPVGKNFAAGMSGGIAYVLDEAGELYRCLNKGLVGMEAVTSRYDRAELRALIEAHVQATGSPKGRRVLENFDELLPKFKKIIPTDYKRLMQLASQFEEQGVPAEQAQVEAFYASLARKA